MYLHIWPEYFHLGSRNKVLQDELTSEISPSSHHARSDHGRWRRARVVPHLAVQLGNQVHVGPLGCGRSTATQVRGIQQRAAPSGAQPSSSASTCKQCRRITSFDCSFRIFDTKLKRLSFEDKNACSSVFVYLYQRWFRPLGDEHPGGCCWRRTCRLRETS